MAKFFNTIKEKLSAFKGWVKKTWANFLTWWKKHDVWDKCTTGLLIFLMASPFLVLGYIILWFAL